MDSKIFARNRILGYVSNSVPLKTRYIEKRKENLIVTCVEKHFYTWSSTKFSLLTVSPRLDDDIHCLAANSFLIFTASGNIVQAWRRGVELQQTYENSSRSSVHLLLPFGPHLIGIDEANFMTVWDVSSCEIYFELNLPKDTFLVTAICHPQTYMNKILLGSKQGALQLWNIHSSKLIYCFTGWNSKVNVLLQSPVIDVIGIGLDNGKIMLHNIKYDDTVMTFIQDWGPVVSLSFCTDNAPIMVSGTTIGHIVFWDLEERKVLSQLLNAHDDMITGLEYFPCEQLIVSSSPDNSLKMWLFDTSRGNARLLRIREGHKTSPSFLRFHGALGNFILSGGSDGYLRAFNTETEIANKNLGRALYHCNKRSLKKRLAEMDEESKSKYVSFVPPIVQFTAETTREKEWDNIVAVHSSLSVVSTWSFNRCKFGRFLGRSDRNESSSFQKTIVTSIFLTHCGNFVLIGYNTGVVDKFNIQSGILRGSFGTPTAHKSTVTGIFVNNVNSFVITGSLDQYLKFWTFRNPNKDRFSEVDLGDPVMFFRSHEESSLLAIAMEDFTILIVDTDCRKIVRRFSGHTNQLTDFTFSPDVRWLVSASMDSTIRTWDLPSAKCVDVIEVEKPCVSITFSPTSACLATAHVGCLGITLWTNRYLFSLVSLTTIEPMKDDIVIDDTSIDDSLITFSTMRDLPICSRWQNILNLDIIKQRNKPKEPLKKEELAPFFLPEVAAVELKFDFTDMKNKKVESSDRILRPKRIETSTEFSKALLKATERNEYIDAAEKLQVESLSAIAFEIDSLAPDVGGSAIHLEQFLKMLEIMFESKKRFEIASAFLAQFLKAHCTMLIKDSALRLALERVSIAHDECWSNLERRLSKGIALSNFFMDS